MSRRLAIALVLALALAAPASGDDLHQKKSTIDARIGALHAHIQTVKRREGRLRVQIEGVTTRIRSLEARVGDVAQQLSTLESDLALHEDRLRKLNALYDLRAEKLDYLRAQYRVSIERLNRRLVAIYESGSEQSNPIGVAFSAGSFQDLLDEIDYVNLIGAQDRKIAAEVRSSRDQVHVELGQTKRAKQSVVAETQAIAVRTHQKQLVKDQLVGSRSRLASERDRKKVSLDELSAQERAEAGEMDALQAQSAALAAQIQAAQARTSGSSPPSASPGAFQWPVSGPITSPFGMRWGRMHEGIDIGVPEGTPIHAAAAGTIIYSGWMEGYGNLVVIDHGGGIATAYGHQSSIAAALGQHVDQGQVIGYVGCTGFCTGPHLHFEVRVNGQAVDPLGYL